MVRGYLLLISLLVLIMLAFGGLEPAQAQPGNWRRQVSGANDAVYWHWLSPDRTLVIYASEDRRDSEIKLWRAPSDGSRRPVQLINFGRPRNTPIPSVAITADNHYAWVQDDDTLYQFNLIGPPEPIVLASSGVRGQPMTSIISNDGQVLFFLVAHGTTEDTRCELFRVPSGQPANTRSLGSINPPPESNGYPIGPCKHSRLQLNSDDTWLTLHIATPTGSVIYSVPAKEDGPIRRIAPRRPEDRANEPLLIAQQNLLLYIVADDPALYKVPLAGPATAATAIFRPSEPGQFIDRFKVSPDGRRVVARVGQRLYTIPIDGGAAALVGAAVGDKEIILRSYTPDSRYIIYEHWQNSGFNQTVMLYSAPADGSAGEGRALHPVPFGLNALVGHLVGIGLSPNGRFIMFGRNKFLTWDEFYIAAASGRGVPARWLPDVRETPKFTTDSANLIYGDGEKLMLLPLDGSAPRRLNNNSSCRTLVGGSTGPFSLDGRRAICKDAGDQVFSLLIDQPESVPFEINGTGVVVERWEHINEARLLFVGNKSYLISARYGPPVVSFAVPAVAFPEAAGSVSIPVRRDEALAAPARVSYRLVAASAGLDDFSLAEGRLEFAPGDTEKLVTVTITQDALFDPGEHFWLELSAPEGVVLEANSRLRIQIQDDEGFQVHLPVVDHPWE